MAYSKSQKKATMKWESENYDQIKCTAPKGFNDKLKTAALTEGISKRQFIIETLSNAIEEAGKMKKYRIVKNYDSWFCVDVPNEENTIITEEELQELSKEWEKPIEELMDDLEETK